MFHHITRLQNRFIICYILSVFLPIILLSCMVYYYQDQKQLEKYLNEKKNSLYLERTYLDNQLRSADNYCNQLTSSYDLLALVKGQYTSEKEIVYVYNSRIYSLISGIYNYDTNLKNIIIYTNNNRASDILKGVEPMTSFYNSVPALSEEDVKQRYSNGWWDVRSDTDDFILSYYAGISNPPMTHFPGIIRLDYNSRIFDTYAGAIPNSSTFLYLHHSQVYDYNETNAALQYMKQYEASLLADKTTPQIITDNHNNLILSSIPLFNGTFHLIRISPYKNGRISFQAILLSLLVSVLVLIGSSIILFLLIFRPFKKIVCLSEHMNQQNDHTLTPYEGSISQDETGDLIQSFNRMANRINHLSSSLLNNEMQLKNAQLEALQAQLNPHFFYGTLESIRMIAESHHEELISEITFSFGNLMRYSLSREYLAQVSYEIEMTKQYISIQEKRLVNRFDIRWNICELDEKWRCPKFILFSMVENVFSHNVSKCRSFIHINVTLIREQNDLIITVQNTGPGLTPKRLHEINYLLTHPEDRQQIISDSNGRSIFNISDRLKLFYGENYNFTIDSKENEITTCGVRIHRNFTNI